MPENRGPSTSQTMSIKLHQSAYEYGQKLIQNRQCVLDLREKRFGLTTSMRAAQRTDSSRNMALRRSANGIWGEDEEEAEHSRQHYKFPLAASG